jgi:hypothetical protein
MFTCVKLDNPFHFAEFVAPALPTGATPRQRGGWIGQHAGLAWTPPSTTYFPCIALHAGAPGQPRHPRQAFTPTEDARLLEFVRRHGPASWDTVARNFPDRSAHQCKDRYVNYLAPVVQAGPWTEQEDRMLMARVQKFGPRWTIVAHGMIGRTANAVKNRWQLKMRPQAIKPNRYDEHEDVPTPGEIRPAQPRSPPQFEIPAGREVCVFSQSRQQRRVALPAAMSLPFVAILDQRFPFLEPQEEDHDTC